MVDYKSIQKINRIIDDLLFDEFRNTEFVIVTRIIPSDIHIVILQNIPYIYIKNLEIEIQSGRFNVQWTPIMISADEWFIPEFLDIIPHSLKQWREACANLDEFYSKSNYAKTEQIKYKNISVPQVYIDSGALFIVELNNKLYVKPEIKYTLSITYGGTPMTVYGYIYINRDQTFVMKSNSIQNAKGSPPRHW